MSDLIKRLRFHSTYALGVSDLDPPYIHEVFGRAADRIEELEAEKKTALMFEIELHECQAENVKLRAVVDAAKRARETDKYGLLSVEKGWDLDKALAELDDE
jgi:hypothetical protein